MKMDFLKKIRIALQIPLLSAAIFLSCSKNSDSNIKQTFFRMNTVVEITLAPPFPVKPEIIRLTLDSLMKYWGERFSPETDSSEILRINTRTNDSVCLSLEAAEMIAMGCAYGDTTEGMFDLTIYPIKKLWGMCDNDTGKSIPDIHEIEREKKRVNYRTIKIDKNRTMRVEDSTVIIDIGGIAKGFALKELDKTLQKKGFKNYLIMAGGDIVSRGKRTDKKNWKIGIQHPRKTGELLAAFEIDSGSVVTSGDYERFRIQNGQRIHHIFNPFTGMSCTANQSVTVWGMDISEIDILSTGLFCRPAEEIVAFIEKRHPKLECLVVDSAGKTHISRFWRNKIQWVDTVR